MAGRSRLFVAGSLLSVLVSLGVGGVTQPAVRGAVYAFLDSLAFLIVAVPFSALLARIGFFEQCARVIPKKNPHRYLWTLAAAVTAVFNLDASIVLLTPIYLTYARKHNLDPKALAYQPLLLSLLASSLLPVSNLTNLYVVSLYHLSTFAFLRLLSLPSLALVLLGYLLWKRRFLRGLKTPKTSFANEDGEVFDLEGIGVGLSATVLVLIGFIFGPSYGLMPFEVVGVADVLLIAYLGLRCKEIAFHRSWIPLTTALGVGASALAAVSLAGRVSVSLGGSTAEKVAALAISGGVVANVLNNIPAVAAMVKMLHPSGDYELAGLLLGVNTAPGLTVFGTLASILWLSILRSYDLDVSAYEFFRVGLEVVVPSFFAALVVLMTISVLRV